MPPIEPDHTSDLGRKKLHFPVLDGLRGLAVLAVVCYHATTALYAQATPMGKALLVVPHFGVLGVQLFFVLSGFLVSLPFWHEKAAGRWLPSGYAAKRFIRIVPCFYFSALALAGIGFFLHGGDWRYPVSALRWMVGWNSYLAGYHSDGVDFNGVYWTLILEIVFYIALPFLFLAFRRFSAGVTAVLLAGLLLAVGIGSRALVIGTAPVGTMAGEMDNLLRGYFTYIDLFSFGILLAYAYEQPPLLKRMKALPVPLLLVAILAIAAGIYIVASASVGPDVPFNVVRATAKYYFAGLFSAVLVLAEFQPATVLHRIFMIPWLGYVGVISYEWYLVHVPFLHWSQEWGGSLSSPGLIVATCLLPVALSFMAAAALHHGFSAPVSRSLRARFLQRGP